MDYICIHCGLKLPEHDFVHHECQLDEFDLAYKNWRAWYALAQQVIGMLKSGITDTRAARVLLERMKALSGGGGEDG